MHKHRNISIAIFIDPLAYFMPPANPPVRILGLVISPLASPPCHVQNCPSVYEVCKVHKRTSINELNATYITENPSIIDASSSRSQLIKRRRLLHVSFFCPSTQRHLGSLCRPYHFSRTPSRREEQPMLHTLKHGPYYRIS